MEKYEKEYKDYFEQVEEDENLKYKVMERLLKKKEEKLFIERLLMHS